MLLSPQLEAFVACATHGSVHGAARALRLTQTAVTKRLAALEGALDATLFLRSRRGLDATDAGTALLNYCRQTLDLEGETLARIKGAADGPTTAHVRLRGPSSVLRARVIPSVMKVLRALPQMTVEFQMSDVGSNVAALKRGECELAILEHEAVAAELDSKRMRPERYVLVGPKAWARREVEEIVKAERIVDFDATDVMTHRVLHKLGLTNLARPDRHLVNNTDALAAMVEAGAGYSCLSEQFGQSLFKSGRLAVLAAKRPYDWRIALAWYPRRHMPSHLAAIIAAID